MIEDEPRLPFDGWLSLVTRQDIMHVVPLQDLQQHYEVNCPCSPIHDGDDVLVHNAYDGRDEVKH